MSGLRLDLLRADTSFKGQVRYASLPAGADVQVRGDAAVEELKLNSLNTGAVSEELLNWKALSAPGIEFNMSPGTPLRLKVREISLADFFARLIINPEGRLVLQDLVGTDGKGSPATAQVSAAQASAPASATAPPPANSASANDPVFDIGPIRLINGRVAFSDRFIKPNYSADLSELSGSMSHVSSQAGAALADLELRGRAEGTASLEITGKLNPLVKPLELNIKGRVRDLELSPLSSYAIKYAGYGIERGKLSVDVTYSVAPNGQLQASNKIVLNQLVFGDEVPGANHLPVKLAVALLADRNGVIDLDLPLSGSINDPEFRVWPIVWKIVGNIIAKALTSPFNLISGLLSGGDAADELSNIAFDAGTAHISESALPSLDQVSKALVDKPGLRLTVVGTASLEREAEAIRRDQLASQLLAEKRRAAASAAKDVTAVSAVSAEEAPALLKEVYRRSNVKKPRNVVGMSKEMNTAEMEALLLQSISVDEDTVRSLALNRSLAVREYLTARQVPSDRLFMGEAEIFPAQADWQPRAELSLEHH
jgi:outer membrane protein OmpA-like peptidoglycan-associated protein